MLRDAEVVLLRQDARFKEVTATGTKQLVRDLISVGAADLKPEVSMLLKVAYSLTKARLIRQELDSVTIAFLERFLNLEITWPRVPASVHAICESDHTFLWMRYDLQRVDALFKRARSLLTDAEFRALVKKYSNLSSNKNERLAELLSELDSFWGKTKRSITTRRVFDEMFVARADEFYEKNEATIQEAILKGGRSGTLGQLPPGLHGEEEPK